MEEKDLSMESVCGEECFDVKEEFTVAEVLELIKFISTDSFYRLKYMDRRGMFNSDEDKYAYMLYEFQYRDFASNERSGDNEKPSFTASHKLLNPKLDNVKENTTNI